MATEWVKLFNSLFLLPLYLFILIYYYLFYRVITVYLFGHGNKLIHRATHPFLAKGLLGAGRGQAKTLPPVNLKVSKINSLCSCTKPWKNYSTRCRLDQLLYYAVFTYILQPTRSNQWYKVWQSGTSVDWRQLSVWNLINRGQTTREIIVPLTSLQRTNDRPHDLCQWAATPF